MSKQQKKQTKTKKVVCPFDKNHLIEEDIIDKHILKCKSPNKMNFEQCKINPKHWVNFNKLAEHEKNCQKEEQFGDETFLHELVDAIGDLNNVNHSFVTYNNSKQPVNMSKRQKKKRQKSMRMAEEDLTNKLWEEPDFGKWLTHNYKEENMASFSNFNFSEDFSDDSFMDFQNM